MKKNVQTLRICLSNDPESNLFYSVPIFDDASIFPCFLASSIIIVVEFNSNVRQPSCRSTENYTYLSKCLTELSFPQASNLLNTWIIWFIFDTTFMTLALGLTLTTDGEWIISNIWSYVKSSKTAKSNAELIMFPSTLCPFIRLFEHSRKSDSLKLNRSKTHQLMTEWSDTRMTDERTPFRWRIELYATHFSI